MADDKSQTSGRDRARVAGEQDYEVRYFAERHGLTVEQTRDLIARHGNDRDKLEEAVRQMKK